MEKTSGWTAALCLRGHLLLQQQRVFFNWGHTTTVDEAKRLIFYVLKLGLENKKITWANLSKLVYIWALSKCTHKNHLDRQVLAFYITECIHSHDGLWIKFKKKEFKKKELTISFGIVVRIRAAVVMTWKLCSCGQEQNMVQLLTNLSTNLKKNPKLN